MGMWISVAIALFFIGSMMTLKPSGIDQRVDKLRMAARRLQLNPKLVACPDWVRGRDDKYGRGMIGQYGLVIEHAQMPHSRYRVVSGQWRPDGSAVATPPKSVALNIPTTVRVNNGLTNSSAVPKSKFFLDKVPLALPVAIEPFVKALEIKPCSIVIYWEDIAYVRSSTNPNYHASTIEPDLLALKEQLQHWAQKVQQKAPQTNSKAMSTDFG